MGEERRRDRSPYDQDRSRRRDDKDRREKRRHRSRSRSRSRDRNRDRDRDKHRDQDRREEKRRRKDTTTPTPPPPDLEALRQKALEATAAATATAESQEEARKLEREKEQRELEEEMEKRRKRIEAWQEQRRKLQEKEEADQAAAEEAAAAAASQKQWNLEDEDDLSDDEEGNAADTTDDMIIENGVAATENGELAAAGASVEAAKDLQIQQQQSMADVAEQSSPSIPELGAAPSSIPKPTHGLQPVDDDDDEEDPLDAFMNQNAKELTMAISKPAAAAEDIEMATAAKEQPPPPLQPKEEEEEDEIDPLDAFMATNVLPEVEKLKAAVEPPPKPVVLKTKIILKTNGRLLPRPDSGAGEATSKPRRRRKGMYDTDSSEEDVFSDEEQGEQSEEDDDEEWMKKLQAGKLTKGDKLSAVDHAAIDYPPFRRNFYNEVPELARMTSEEVEAYRLQLDGIKVRGKNAPKPVKNWNQCGLSGRVLEVLKRAGFDRPLPIQAQALPVIMSGRDCIGIAKTGSGKTMGYVLPMIRHVKDQPPLAQGDGPIALVMAPTRELVTQIGREVRRIAKAAALTSTCVYGGSGVANQITELKRGVEIVVCTPGRMIDILVTSGGKITNLRRVTYLVLDEADRMFDMGFEPQIMRVVNNIRPDRQTVMFSATFPRSVEVLARSVLHEPVEVQVGGRSIVNKDITQYVEIRPEGERFLRLLQILGEWYERGKLLIFVNSQDRCDTLFRDLLRAGYPCLSLHGGKDQSDRESTISDFKSNVCNILVATSVAARGLDVKDLVLVVNYDVPNHHEEYVHRVGRTGRAGAKGTAITFLSTEEEQYAPDLVKALTESGAVVPQDLQLLSDGFEKKRKAGTVKAHGSGYGGSGFKFDAAEDDMIKALKKATAKDFGMTEESESDEEDDTIQEVVTTTGGGGGGEVAEPSTVDISALPPEVQARIKAAQAVAERLQAANPNTAIQQQQQQGLPTTMGQPTLLQHQQQGMPIPTTAGQPQQFQMQPPTATGGGAPLNPALAAAQAMAQQLAMRTAIAGGTGMPMPGQQPLGGVNPNVAAAAAAALQQMGGVPAAPTTAGVGVGGAAVAGPPAPSKHFETELEINDFPQGARWKITHRDTLRDIGAEIGAAVVVKGRYYKPGTVIPEGERKLYLHIIGPSADTVRKAKQEVKRILEESTEKAMRREGPSGGRYSVM